MGTVDNAERRRRRPAKRWRDEEDTVGQMTCVVNYPGPLRHMHIYEHNIVYNNIIMYTGRTKSGREDDIAISTAATI